MKKLLSLFVTIFALLAVACGGDDVDKPAPKPGPEEPSTASFEVDITEITRGSVTFDVTPSDPTVDYLCLVYEKTKVDEFKKDEHFVRDVMTELTAEASNKGLTLSEYMPEMVDSGDIVNVKFSGLQMATDYYVVVFGVEASKETFVSSTEVLKVPFKTLDVQASDCTFDVGVSVLYNTATISVTPSDKKILWYCCTVTKDYLNMNVGEGEGKMSLESFYRTYFASELNRLLQSGYSFGDIVHSGELRMLARDLYANTEYCYLVAGLIKDDEGIVITTDVTMGTYTTGDPQPSTMFFDIQIYDVQQMSVAFTVTPSNDNDLYLCQVQPWDGVSTADEIMHQMVEQWGPSWMAVQANTKGFVDFATTPKSLPAAGMDYCIIVFGYSGGITTDAYMKTFRTPPGGSIEDVEFSVSASAISSYGFTLNVTSSDPTIYFVPGACVKEEYNEAKYIAAVNDEFDYLFEETKTTFDPTTIVAEILDQYYFCGSQQFTLTALPDTEYMVYIYALDINTGHVAKVFTFDAVARTGTVGSIQPKIEIVGYYSGDDEAGTIWGNASQTAGRAITVVKYTNLEGATSLHTTMVNDDYSDILKYPDYQMWEATTNTWKNCSLDQPYTFYLSDWNVVRTALAYVTDGDNKAGLMARKYTKPSAENKSDIEELRALKTRLDEEAAEKKTRALLSTSLVVPESI